MNSFRLWCARFLLGLGVLIIFLGVLTFNLTPIVGGAVVLGLGHGILVVGELLTQTKTLVSLTYGARRRERDYEGSDARPDHRGVSRGTSVQDDPPEFVEPYDRRGERAGA